MSRLATHPPTLAARPPPNVAAPMACVVAEVPTTRTTVYLLGEDGSCTLHEALAGPVLDSRTGRH
jgi:hypothetical protein